MPSMIREWVTRLPLRHQGVILAGMRGCDVAPKNPYDSPERQLVAYLRWVTCNPADPREVGMAGSYMQNWAPTHWKQSDLGHYPLHWVSHLMHAYQVVGYSHPDQSIGLECFRIYVKFVEGLHLKIETADEMDRRLTEDRIANGTVVS